MRPMVYKFRNILHFSDTCLPQADDDLEFKGEFDHRIEDSRMIHLWTYPKSLKMNTVCEYLNHTVPKLIQKQLVDFLEDILFTDLELFSEKPAG